jgi:hypothetical protein
MPPSDPAGGDLKAAETPTLQPGLRGLPKSTGFTNAKSAHNGRLQRMANRTSASQRILTDAQVLDVLENRRVASDAPADEVIGADIAVLPPEDTNTRRVLREAVARNAPVSFAVQLQWSVQPIDLKSVPRHPIFRAYTLYAAEGRRTGRTWFFLRLGFFSDAVSAKQVAHYLRRDFASASVVPVSSQERQQVSQTGHCADSGTVARGPGRARRTQSL